MQAILEVVKAVVLCNAVFTRYNRFVSDQNASIAASISPRQALLLPLSNVHHISNNNNNNSNVKNKFKFQKPTIITPMSKTSDAITLMKSPPLKHALFLLTIIGFGGTMLSRLLRFEISLSPLTNPLALPLTTIIWMATVYAPNRVLYRVTMHPYVHFVLILLEAYQRSMTVCSNIEAGIKFRSDYYYYYYSSNNNNNNNNNNYDHHHHHQLHAAVDATSAVAGVVEDGDYGNPTLTTTATATSFLVMAYLWIAPLLMGYLSGCGGSLLSSPAFSLIFGKRITAAWEFTNPTWSSKLPLFCSLLYALVLRRIGAVSLHQDRLHDDGDEVLMRAVPGWIIVLLIYIAVNVFYFWRRQRSKTTALAVTTPISNSNSNNNNNNNNNNNRAAAGVVSSAKPASPVFVPSIATTTTTTTTTTTPTKQQQQQQQRKHPFLAPSPPPPPQAPQQHPNQKVVQSPHAVVSSAAAAATTTTTSKGGGQDVAFVVSPSTAVAGGEEEGLGYHNYDDTNKKIV